MSNFLQMIQSNIIYSICMTFHLSIAKLAAQRMNFIIFFFHSNSTMDGKRQKIVHSFVYFYINQVYSHFGKQYLSVIQWDLCALGGHRMCCFLFHCHISYMFVCLCVCVYVWCVVCGVWSVDVDCRYQK